MKTLADLTSPMEVVRVMLERDLQDQCVSWMKREGWWARKFSSISQRSVPDYLFAKKVSGLEDGDRPVIISAKLACEFKKPGTRPKLLKKYGVTVMSTEAQYEEQLKMRDAGWYVFECDNFSLFKGTIQAYTMGLFIC